MTKNTKESGRPIEIDTKLFLELDDKLFLQVDITRMLIDRWGISEEDFVEMDKELGIIRHLGINYERYHLTGDEGIMQEVEEYIRRGGGVIK